MDVNSTFYSGKKVLVAGGTGTIGIPVVSLLMQHGAEVTVVSLDSKEFAAAVLPREITFQQLDLRSLEQCLVATEGMDHVLNLVGIKGSVGIGQSKAASFFVSMLQFQTNLMEAAFRNCVS